MCFLGDMYLWGRGVDKNDAEAYRWFVSALTADPKPRPIRPVDFVTLRGTRKYCEGNRDQAARGLSADARASAELAAKEWLTRLRYSRIP
jgi:TPR repeat protein